MILPADLKPRPVFASGLFRVASQFTGRAVQLFNPATGFNLEMAFGSDGKLDAGALDAYRVGLIVKVTAREDQMHARGLSTTLARAPKIGGLALGAHRCMWLEGDSQVENVAPTGQIIGMDTATTTLADLGIHGNNYTLMMVMQPHSGIHCSQVDGVARGTVFSMADAGGGPVSRLFNDGPGDGATAGGHYSMTDIFGIDYRSTGPVETSPVILTLIVRPDGVFIGQNEDFRSAAVAPTNAALADTLRIGYHEDSAETGAGNQGGGFSELLTMVWNQALTMRQAAVVRGPLYDLVGIDVRRSRPSAPLVMTFSDSVWAGYKGDDIRGWDKRAALQLPSRIRWMNYAVPGSPLIPQAPDVPLFGYTLGAFDGWMTKAVRMHKGKVHAVWGAPINDVKITPQPTPDYVYNNGTLALMAKIRAIDPSATITLCTSTGVSEAPVHDWQVQWNTLARNGAAANNYGLVDFAADPFLADPFSLANKDGTHLTNAGFDREAELLLPRIAAWEAGLP